MSLPDKPSTYFRVRVSNVPRSLENDISELCFSHQALGLSEALSFAQPDLTYDPSVLPRATIEFDVFFSSPPADLFFQSLKTIGGGIRAELMEEENKDWLAEWKKGFLPFKLIGSIWVVPSWLEKPEAAEHQILIDPGMAFGTGTHATTKMASYFVHKISQEFDEQVKGWTLLDVGTGTAILAVLAEICGFGLVTGIEIDPEARRKARENCQLNKSSSVEISDLQLDELKDSYDVVVANIIDGVLIRLRKDLLRVLRPGGHLFLTGILQERDDHFFKNFIEASPELKVKKRIQKDEWVGYWVQKNSHA
jgi:ribosomal protein L11 methyltransferase